MILELILFPLIVGAAIVVQGGMNRIIGTQMGLSASILLNSVIVLVFSIVAFALSRMGPGGEGVVQSWSLKPWMIFPGFCGFVIVYGIPFAMSRIGAFQMFVGLLAAQLLAGLLWDAWVEGKPIGMMRILGAVVAMLGALIATRD